MTDPHVEVNGREYVTKDWHGLMEILDDIYPAAIFTGASGDPGPLIVTHLREIARLRGISVESQTATT